MPLRPRHGAAVLALGLGATALLAPTASAASTYATFDAIVALDNCSGSVVRFPDAADTDQAIVLTNGHCLPTMPDPDTFVQDKAVSRSVTILGGEDAHKVMTGSCTPR